MNLFKYKGVFSIKLSISSRYTKQEKKFLTSIIELLENKTLENLIISETVFLNLSSHKISNATNFFLNLQKKYVSYEIKESYDILSGFFRPISSFIILNNSIHLFFSKEFLEFFKKDSYFYKYNAKSFFKFFEKHSPLIYENIFNSKSQDLYFSLDQLKNIISPSSEYERFYDFERFILKKIVDDINTNTNFQISYEKIKNSSGGNSKIVGINFKSLEIEKNIKTTFINTLLEKYSHNIDNFKECSNLIKEISCNFSQEQLENIFSEASNIKNPNISFYNKIKKVLREMEENKYTLLRTNKIYTKDLFKIYSFVISELKKVNISEDFVDLLSMNNLLADLLKLDIGQNKIYNYENFKIDIIKGVSFTSINIYKC